METLDKLIVDWGVASQTLAGEVESGDKHVVKIFPHGALLAAVDGLGHGEEAAAAANMAVRLPQAPGKRGGSALLQRAHERVRSTPGGGGELVRVQSGGETMDRLGLGE